jgi:hypothetical protein
VLKTQASLGRVGRCSELAVNSALLVLPYAPGGRLAGRAHWAHACPVADYAYSEVESEQIQIAAEKLYGLIHARYIITVRGLAQMVCGGRHGRRLIGLHGVLSDAVLSAIVSACSASSSVQTHGGTLGCMFLCHCCVEALTPVALPPTQAEKYQRGDFGQCPRVLCNFAKLAPVAVSDKTDVACVQTYCPSCREIYKPANRKHMSLDGAYFGTSFAHILFMVHPALLPAKITADTKYVGPPASLPYWHRPAWAVLRSNFSGVEAVKRGLDYGRLKVPWPAGLVDENPRGSVSIRPGYHGNPPPQTPATGTSPRSLASGCTNQRARGTADPVLSFHNRYRSVSNIERVRAQLWELQVLFRTAIAPGSVSVMAFVGVSC